MYPETSVAGVLEITDQSGDIKNIGGQEGHVSVSGQDSLLLAEMATIGEKVVVRAEKHRKVVYGYRPSLSLTIIKTC